MDRKQSSTMIVRGNTLKTLCVLLCLTIFSISKAQQLTDSIPEERKHLLEILNDTTEKGTFDKKKLNDGGSRVLSQGRQKSDWGIRSLVPRDSAFVIKCGCGSSSKKEPPVIYIDGVKAASVELKKLRPERIKSFSVLKDSKAIEPYGEEGKNGVIIITTKPVE